jgi:small conductance mechanosensitive channel
MDFPSTENISVNLKKQALSFNKAVDLLVDKLTGWAEKAILILPNLLVAILILVISVFLSNLVGKLITKVLKRYLKNRALANFVVTLSKVLVVFLGLLLATSVLHLDQAITSLLAGLGIVGVALGFAFQDISANFVSGVAMAVKDKYPFAVGDLIQTQDIIGNVEHMNLRATTIKTFQGQAIIVPNKVIYEKPITNYSFIGMRRVDLEVGVSYAEDLEKVQAVVLDAIKDLEDLIEGKELEFYYKDFRESSVNFELRFWVKFDKQNEYLNARHEAIKAIKKAFDANGITIPFPIRTLDFGIKKGKSLSEMVISTKDSVN